jgi:hypothetical protein
MPKQRRQPDLVRSATLAPVHRRRRLLYDDEPSRIRELWKDEPEVYALLLQVNLRGLKGGPLARLHAAVVLREAMGDRIDFEVLKRLSPRLSAGVPARVVSTKSLYDGKPRRRRPRAATTAWKSTRTFSRG